MSIYIALVLPVAAAFLIALIGKVIASYRERDPWSYRDRGAKNIERVTLLLAALIIILAVIFQITTANTAVKPTISTVRSPSGGLICIAGSVSIDGSSALFPLVSTAAKDYMAKCSQATIDVKKSSSNQGLSLVEQGKIQIADSDLSALPTQGDLIDHRIAVIVFAIAVNPSVTHVTTLTQGHLKEIFDHTITNWDKVGGPNLPIQVFTRIPSSGTRITFQNYVLCSSEPSSDNDLNTNDEVAQHIQQTAGGIGYVDVATAIQSHLVTIAINGQSPLPELVEQNSYSFWSIEHMYTKGLPTTDSLTNAFIQYMTNTPAEELLAQSLSFVNINTMLNSGLSSHQSCA